MKDPSGYYSRRPLWAMILIKGRKVKEDDTEGYRVHKLTDKEARCLECPLPEFNVRACSKCPFDLPEDDPCRTCSSKRICEAYHATCGEKQRWTKKQSAASEN